MKTTATIGVIMLVLLLPTAVISQHDHESSEHFFSTRNISVFEQNLGMELEDYIYQNILDYIDGKYQDFHEEIETRLHGGEEISDADFLAEYNDLINETKNEMDQMRKVPFPNGGNRVADGPCVNMDFETGDLSGWTLTRGNVDGSAPYSFVGEFPVGPGPYHTVYGGGVDPVCGIPRVDPLGGGFSTRLGNGTGVGARAARIKQTFLVDATNYLFTYSYAVVFQSPVGHGLNQQPYFTVRVFDSLGNSVPCGEYSVIADAASAPDYETTTWGGSTVLYKDWTNVFANLTAYIGQNVTVEFTSGDCSLTGHFGYAYIDASCAFSDIIASSPTICAGDSSLLTAPPGAASYLWSNGTTTQSTMVYTGGLYSCTLTPFQGGGCTITLDLTITEYPSPTALFAPTAPSVCLGSPTVFTDMSSIPPPGVITGYRWDFDDGIVTPISIGPIVAVPLTAGTYILPSHTYAAPGVYNVQLYVTTIDGCADSITLPVTVLALPIVVAGPDQQVCDGIPIILSGAGAVSYLWDNGVTDGIPFTPAVGTITYTVTGTDANGCSNTDQVDVTVWPLPVVNAGPDQQVCDGSPVTLSGTGAVLYAWDNGVTDGVPFVPVVGTITYTVTGTDANGCINTDQVDVTVHPLPVINAGLDQQVCSGVVVTLSGSGGILYAWDNGITDGVPFSQVVGTITYTVTGTDANGCVNTDQVDVTVYPLPVIDAGVDQQVCDGSPVTLFGSGGVSYLWDNGVTNGVPFTPAVGTITYTVTGTDANGCQNTDQVDVTVYPLPVINAGVDQQVCDGEPVTLNGSGGVSYLWDNGVFDGVPFIPAVGTITYIVTGTDVNGCINTDQVDVTVYPLPVINAGVDQQVCDGAPVTLNGSGGVSYLWNNGVLDGVPFTPVVGTITYTVTGTDVNGCINTDQVDVTVYPLPVINAGVDQQVCDGTPVTLNGTGGVSYLWDNGVLDGVPFTPAVGTVTYTVTGTDANGCVNTDQVDVTVYALPSVSGGPDQEICEGESVTLSGSGATGYIWDNGVIDGVPFFPGVGTITYIVIGTDDNGCSNSDQVDVKVNPLPTIDGGQDRTVCDDQQVTLTATGAPILVWDLGVVNGVPFNAPVGTTVYTVIGIDANGCSNTDQVSITVNALPSVSAGIDQTVCDGESVTLSGSGATSYIWTGGVIDGVPFTPAVGSYEFIVTGTNGNLCSNNDTVVVIVNPNPVINAGADQNGCENDMITLNAVGSPNLYWDNGVINGVPFQQLVGVVTYTVVDSLSTGCTASDMVQVEINLRPVVSAEDKDICEGEGVTLEGQGAVSYSWTGGVLDGIEFFPSESGEYTVTGTNVFGCTADATVTVTVSAAPIVNFKILDMTLSTSSPGTGFDNLTTGAVSYEWDFGDGSTINTEFEPYHEFPTQESGSYEITLTAYSAAGCPGQKIKYVYVTQDYTIYVPNAFTPDGDGSNEIFKPVMDGFDENDYTLYIFNRWGELIFESHDMEVGWDGEYLRHDERVQDGVFTWKIIAGLKGSADTKIFVGHVSLLK